MENNKLQEVEIRARLDDKLSNFVKQKLNENKAGFLHSEEITDNYWCKASAMNFEDARMDKVGTFSLRTRKRVKDGNKTNDLNIKIITRENDHNAWDEHETGISNFDETENILKGLGHKIFFSLVKSRETYELSEFTITIENIENYGMVIEVEQMLPAELAESGKNKIKEFMLTTFGIGEANIIPKTPVNEMMQTMAKF